MPPSRMSKVVLWSFLLFNLAIAASLVFDPGQIDAQYRGGPMTPTRQFQWFSIAGFHVVMAAVTWVSLSMRHASERRKLHLINAGFYGWDAITQWVYWGDHVGVEPTVLHVNAGVSAAVCALVLVLVWWRDRDPAERS